jgi:DNA-binding Xre family transcriptional regulator
MKTPDERILRLVELLKFQRKISTQKEFCEEIGMVRQTITKIKTKQSHFTVQQIELMCKKYHVNANWIFGLENKVFSNNDDFEFSN